jgi:hypothetical protein
METDVSTQQCKRRRYYGNGDVIYEYKEGLGMNLSVGSGDRSSTNVLVCRARGAREFIRWTVKTFDSRGW